MHDALDELYDFMAEGGKKTSEILRGFKETLQYMIGRGVMTEAEGEEIMWKINDALEAEGYVALKGVGGALMGGGRDHNVKVWLDPGKVTINDVMDKQGSYLEAQRELAKLRGEFENLGGENAYPNGAPPQYGTGANEPMNKGRTATQAYQDYRDWQMAKEAVEDQELKFIRGGDFHEEQQARNWATHQANYNNVLADATKEERAALDAAKAARDTRAGQRESIVRSGPDVGSQVWPSGTARPGRPCRAGAEGQGSELHPAALPAEGGQRLGAWRKRKPG
jgi:hypothetical protein